MSILHFIRIFKIQRSDEILEQGLALTFHFGPLSRITYCIKNEEIVLVHQEYKMSNLVIALRPLLRERFEVLGVMGSLPR